LEKSYDAIPAKIKSKKLNPLDTRYFLPDERSLGDFLKFINRLSRLVVFYDENSQQKGDWYDFFISDELFLLAEIESFDLKSIEKDKTEILLKFEKTDSLQEKSALILALFGQLKLMMHTIDSWYTLSSKSNKQLESSPLEKELVAAISYRCKEVYAQMKLIVSELDQLGSPLKLDLQDLNLGKLWGAKDQPLNTSLNWGADILKPDYLLKQLLLLHRPMYKTLLNLTERSGTLLQENLRHKDDHEPHIGLLLAFFQLFKKLQQEINTVPDRLLTYYYEQILGQTRKGQIPDLLHCYVTVDPAADPLWIAEGTRVLAGQNKDGQDMLYEVTDTVRISTSKLASLYTLHISRNTLIDPGTSFQTVNGIYSRKIDPTDKFESFLALGEEQRFLSEDQKTMEEVSIGFAISSPTLKMKGGHREVEVAFVFLSESYHYFLAMLLSVAKGKNQLPEEIFHQLFSGSLHLTYTTDTGWAEIDSFEVIPPQDWNENGFRLAFTLGPGMSEFAPYQEQIHQEGMGVNQPTLKIRLKNQNVFHPYSFLQFLELEQIRISVVVKKLKSLSLHSSFGPLDQSIPFDLFGPTPKAGSYLLIGNDEVFSKDLDELKIGWTFFGLPVGEDMKSYFSGYPYAIDNDSFKVKIQALSDFRFMPSDLTDPQLIKLFETKDGELVKERVLEDIDLAELDIMPDYRLSLQDTDEVPLSQKTGFIKLELVSPSIGFGFDVYSDVYNKSMTMSTVRQIEKPKSGFTFEAPKEPFSPMATDIFLDYKSSSEINFLGTKSFVNQTDKGENVIQIHPFGQKFLLKDGLVFDNRLLPYFELQGAIFLGIESGQFPEEFSILFQISKNESWSHGDAPVLDWFYLSSDEWKPFRQEDVLFDGTYGLTRSGIISFKSPQDINQHNQVMPASNYWICCQTLRNADMASRIAGIYLNAFTARAILEEDKHHDPILPAFSVQSFENNIPGILELIQPIPSTGGRPVEDKLAFYKRVSESLKHKHRAVTRWDIERMLMNEFSWLGFVKVFGNFGHEEFIEPGCITIVGVPQIVDRGSFYQPKLNPGQIKEMDFFLKKIANPFMKVKVLNPQYEYLMIKGKIKFNSPDTGQLFKKLYRDLLEVVCPWFYHDLSEIFANREAKKSEILNLILSRPYVKFLTGFSLAHLFKNDQGDFNFFDGALLDDGMDTLVIGKPWSVIVPYPLKNLEIVQEENYRPAEPFDLENLILGENLIITSEDNESSLGSTSPEEGKSTPQDEEVYHFTFRF
jgi:hypothetical protein